MRDIATWSQSRLEPWAFWDTVEFESSYLDLVCSTFGAIQIETSAQLSTVNTSALFSLLNRANKNSLVRSEFKRLTTASFLAYVNRKRKGFGFAALETLPDDWIHPLERP